MSIPPLDERSAVCPFPWRCSLSHFGPNAVLIVGLRGRGRGPGSEGETSGGRGAYRNGRGQRGFRGGRGRGRGGRGRGGRWGPVTAFAGGDAARGDDEGAAVGTGGGNNQA